jgi:hypothetical protein
MGDRRYRFWILDCGMWIEKKKAVYSLQSTVDRKESGDRNA